MKDTAIVVGITFIVVLSIGIQHLKERCIKWKRKKQK